MPNRTPLAERFRALDAFLLEHQSLWRPRPFVERRLAWENDHPELAAWLRSRSLSDAEAVQRDPAMLKAPAPFAALAEQARRLSEVEPLPGHPAPAGEHRQQLDVPGRKWQQIEAFAARLQFTERLSLIHI